MNSYTSNSRHEWKVVLAVLLVLMGAESGTRLFESNLSKDIIHLQSFKQIAQDIHRESLNNRTTILFLGNSMTREGVDVEAFKQCIEQPSSKECFVTRIMPDNTALADWYYAYKHFLTAQ